MKETYTAALLELIAAGEDVSRVLSGFAATVKARGHEQLQVPVLQAVVRKLSAQKPATVVTVKNDAALTAFKAEIDSVLSTLGGNEPAVVKDDTIVGGYIVEHAGRRYDASYKSKLVDLYRSLTK